MIALRPIAKLTATIIGALISFGAAFVGYAASATGNYGNLLRLWATGTALGLTVLGWQAMILRGWFRYVTVAIAVLVVAMSVDPLRRLALLGWWGR